MKRILKVSSLFLVFILIASLLTSCTAKVTTVINEDEICSLNIKYYMNEAEAAVASLQLGMNAKSLPQEEVDGKMYYVYFEESNFTSIKELEKHLIISKSDYSESGMFEYGEISIRDMWLYLSPENFTQLTGEEFLSTKLDASFTFPYAVTKTNGTIDLTNNKTVTFDFETIKRNPYLYLVTEKSTASWGKAEDIKKELSKKIFTQQSSYIDYNFGLNTDKSVKFSWYKVDEATSYEVYGKDSVNETWKKIGTTTSSKRTFEHKNLKLGVKYRYKVRAVKTIDGVNYNSRMSNTRSIRAFNTTKKSGFKTTSYKSALKIKVDSFYYADGYNIYLSKSKNKGFKKIANIKYYDSMSYTKMNLDAKTKYYVKVKAYSKIGGKYYYSKDNVKAVKTK